MTLNIGENKSCQCYNINTFVSSAHPKLEYDNRLKSVQTVKAGSTLNLSINISGIPSPTIGWLRDGQPISKSPRLSIDISEDFTTLTVKNATLDDKGVYTLTAENVVGKATADFEVAVRGESPTPGMLVYNWICRRKCNDFLRG